MGAWDKQACLVSVVLLNAVVATRLCSWVQDVDMKLKQARWPTRPSSMKHWHWLKLIYFLSLLLSGLPRKSFQSFSLKRKEKKWKKWKVWRYVLKWIQFWKGFCSFTLFSMELSQSFYLGSLHTVEISAWIQ